MKISVVIPTVNRPRAILEVTKDLLIQSGIDFELLVVDQSQEDNQELVSLSRRDSRLRYIHSHDVGTCRARNLGASQAASDIVVFFDDDVRIEDQVLLQKHVQNYHDATIGGVGGRVIDVNTALNRQQSGPVCQVSATGQVYANATSLTRQDIKAPRGGHMSFRRSVISQVGGFDERFRGNAMREETDFSLRTTRAGWRIVFDPTVTITHLALAGGSRTKERIAWYEDFFFNEFYFILKNFPIWVIGLTLVRKTRPILACAIYYGRLKWRAVTAPWRMLRQAWQLTRRRGQVRLSP